MPSPAYLIYGLFDPRNRQLRYVGKTEGSTADPLRTRLNHHCFRALHQKTNTHKANWIKSILLLGLRPEIAVLEKASSHDELVEAEIWSIAYYRSLGCNLTNKTLGGEGCFGYRHSEEAKKRMSELKKGKPGPRKGSKHPLSVRLLVSRTKTGLSEEHQSQILKMYRNSVSFKDIAGQLGIDRNSASRIAKMMSELDDNE